jgi:hypothetical protein
VYRGINIAMLKASEKGQWITKGVISASDCFSCANRIDHEVKGRRISILCRNPCNFIKCMDEEENET